MLVPYAASLGCHLSAFHVGQSEKRGGEAAVGRQDPHAPEGVAVWIAETDTWSTWIMERKGLLWIHPRARASGLMVISVTLQQNV